MKAKLVIAMLLFVLSISSIVNAQTWNLNGNGSTNPGVEFLGTTDAKDVVFKVGGIERMRLFYNPAAPRWCRFTVDGSIGTTGSQAGLLLFDRQTDQKSSLWYSPTPGETRLYDYATGAERLVIKNNGNIGIGTVNATAKLTVNGSALVGDPGTVTLPSGYKLYVQDGILTEKVKIALVATANWSDFVFANDYKLLPLSEVEAFVKANKHLPGIPSAQNLVDDGGVDVQVMLAKQMQKIEELTLYIIAQDKKIHALEEKYQH